MKHQKIAALIEKATPPNIEFYPTNLTCYVCEKRIGVIGQGLVEWEWLDRDEESTRVRAFTLSHGECRMNRMACSPLQDFVTLADTTLTDQMQRAGMLRGMVESDRVFIDGLKKFRIQLKQRAVMTSYTRQFFEKERRVARLRELDPKYNVNSEHDVTGVVWPSLRVEILIRDGARCQLCGAGPMDGTTLHIDHKIPRAEGGLTIPANLWVLCQECNVAKNDTVYSKKKLDDIHQSNQRVSAEKKPQTHKTHAVPKAPRQLLWDMSA